MRSTARLVGEERRDAHGERQGGVGEGMRPAVPSNDVRASSTRRVCASTRLTRPSRLASDGACTPARVYKPRWSLSLRPTRSRGCEMLARPVTQQSILSTKPRTGSVVTQGCSPIVSFAAHSRGVFQCPAARGHRDVRLGGAVCPARARWQQQGRRRIASSARAVAVLNETKRKAPSTCNSDHEGRFSRWWRSSP